ncbi:Peroxygenase 1 [Ophidiomyces ophidiicola]|nr:Peroxygenase 1 [Ophidiomyces ophidiicola]KAI1999210.1 Peroxygenase 1 [Ophidiomyces ophidiicola]
MSGPPNIRHATTHDVPTILDFIRAGAAATSSLDHVEATETSLRATLNFADSPAGHPGVARTLLLEAPEGVVAGMAVYYYNYSTWRAKPGVILEELFVRPEFRRRGYARRLIAELAGEVRRIGGVRVEWVCLRDNAAALQLYESLGATRMEDWVTLRVSGEALDRLAEV